MRESRTYGSVRGALSNGRPYRDQRYAGSEFKGLPRISLRSSGLRSLRSFFSLSPLPRAADAL
jgi:hypothetical protein